ncbi:MAG: SulP family inorganic anion transporter [Planctomycetota bacterium]
MTPPAATPDRTTSQRLTPAATLRIDLLAGVSVALVGLPQCLAYAMVAGLPPVYGLATAAVPGLIAALIGRSPWVVTGPTNTTGLLILAALTPFIAQSDTGFLPAQFLPVLAVLTLLAGLMRLLLVSTGGWVIVRYVPESVLVGFTAGAGILIGVMQFDEALGLRSGGTGFLNELQKVAASIGSAPPAWPAIIVTILSIAAVALGKRFLKRWPIALVTVAAGALVAFLTGLDQSGGLPLVKDRLAVPSGWPAGAMPWEMFTSPPAGIADPWSLLAQLLLPAFAITLLGTMELLVSARVDGSRADLSREIKAQGWANIGGAFTSCFPASASLTRSALLRMDNARTRLAAGFGAVAVVPVMLFAGPLVGYIPQASLAGVLLVVAAGMLDRKRIWRCMVVGAVPRVLMFVTLGATLLLPLEWGILVGCGLSLMIHLSQQQVPRVRRLAVLPGADATHIRLRESDDAEAAASPVTVLEVSGVLHFAAVDPCIDRIAELLPEGATAGHVVVIDITHAHQMRLAALDAFDRLHQQLARRGIALHLAGVDEPFATVLQRTGSVVPWIADHGDPSESVRRALEAAGALPAQV